jgi:hypothetical protein
VGIVDKAVELEILLARYGWNQLYTNNHKLEWQVLLLDLLWR